MRISDWSSDGALPICGRTGCRCTETEESGMTSPLYADLPGDVSISFEFFPPKTATMEETLWQSIQTLEPLKTRFVSVTYGAGGSNRERTDRKSVVVGKGVPVGVDLGGRRIIKKKK